jgi:hypothetical protein
MTTGVSQSIRSLRGEKGEDRGPCINVPHSLPNIRPIISKTEESGKDFLYIKVFSI